MSNNILKMSYYKRDFSDVDDILTFPGSFVIKFKDVNGYLTPEDEDIVVDNTDLIIPTLYLPLPDFYWLMSSKNFFTENNPYQPQIVDDNKYIQLEKLVLNGHYGTNFGDSAIHTIDDPYFIYPQTGKTKLSLLGNKFTIFFVSSFKYYEDFIPLHEQTQAAINFYNNSNTINFLLSFINFQFSFGNSKMSFSNSDEVKYMFPSNDDFVVWTYEISLQPFSFSIRKNGKLLEFSSDICENNEDYQDGLYLQFQNAIAKIITYDYNFGNYSKFGNFYLYMKSFDEVDRKFIENALIKVFDIKVKDEEEFFTLEPSTELFIDAINETSKHTPGYWRNKENGNYSFYYELPILTHFYEYDSFVKSADESYAAFLVSTSDINNIDIPEKLKGNIIISLLPGNINGQWRFVGEELWRNPGLATVIQGEYEIEFKHVIGYKTPSNSTVTISSIDLYLVFYYSILPVYEQPKMLPDQWIIQFNTSMSACVVSPTDNSLRIYASFRSSSDYAGLLFKSLDENWHQQICYKEDHNYSNYKMTFNISYSGDVAHFNDTIQKPALVIDYDNGSSKYVTLGFCSNTSSTTETFNNYTYPPSTDTYLSNKWIVWNSVTLHWKPVDPPEPGFDINDPNNADLLDQYNQMVANYYTEKDMGNGEYFVDYVTGRWEAYVAVEGTMTISYHYNRHETFTLDFNNMYQGESESSKEQASSSGIKMITIPFLYKNFIQSGKEGSDLILGSKHEIEVNLTNISVTHNGNELEEVEIYRVPNNLQIAEGYDDDYYRNPKRLIKAMYGLGYCNRITVYMGASHFYEQVGIEGASSKESDSEGNWTQCYTCDATTGANIAVKNWWKYFLKEAKGKFSEVVCSISMEVLHIPSSWAQMTTSIDGVQYMAQTGWTPPTKFYSPVNTDVRNFVSKYVIDFLNIMQQEGFTPTLQMGEPWWWIQSNQPGGGYTFEGTGGWWTNCPCFYDNATQNLYTKETGQIMPSWTNVNEITEDVSSINVATWLQAKLVDYINFIRSIVKNNFSNGRFTCLFFPPSVLDTSKPWITQIVNYPKNAFLYPNCDFFQIEDYDWVMYPNERVNALHQETYTFCQDLLGYETYNVDYFAGFAWVDNIDVYWDRIKRAIYEAKKYSLPITIWAFSEVTRDSWSF